MAAPKYIKAKAEQLARALAKVDQLSDELERWYASKEGWEMGQEFFHNQHLDNPWEFRLADVLEALDEAGYGNA